MNSKSLYGFLALSFLAHAVAFGILSQKRKSRRHFYLTLTFVSLTLIFGLQFKSLVPSLNPMGFILALILLLAVKGLRQNLSKSLPLAWVILAALYGYKYPSLITSPSFLLVWLLRACAISTTTLAFSKK